MKQGKEDAKVRQPRPTANAVTARDVARTAGVSVATVSRVLNGNDKVAPTLRASVEQAAARLNYTPHAAARALARQQTMTLGAIVPTLEDANFALAIEALQRRASAAGYTLLLASSNYNPQEELRQIRALVSQGIAGLMLVGARHAQEAYALLAARRIPFVNTWVLDEQHPCVGFDNRAIGRALANYLLDLGHTEFGVIVQRSPESDRAASRMAGIREALCARGVTLPQACLIERSHKLSDGQVALRALMAGKTRPTAIICGTDTLAFGALVEARNLEIAVPAELSITGINDIEFAAHVVPPLTTVRLAADAIGERAADFLLASIAGESTAAVTPITFELIVRGSTAPPNAATSARRNNKK